MEQMCSVLSSHDQAMQLDCADFSSETSHIHLAWLENGNAFSRLHFYITNQFHTGLDTTRKQLLQPAFKCTRMRGSNCTPVASAVAAVFTTADCIFTFREQWLWHLALVTVKGKASWFAWRETRVPQLATTAQTKAIWLCVAIQKIGQMKLINFTGPLEQMFVYPPTLFV